MQTSQVETRNIVIIVQARMGSSRLPNKMLLCLHRHPVIEWVRLRIRRAKLFHKLVFAIPDTDRDLVLKHYLSRKGEAVFKGSESDVLGRFYSAAAKYKASHIVRVCADNPCICPKEIDNLISYYFDNSCDYAYNHIPKNNTYANGLGAEIVSWEVLTKINQMADRPLQREHVFNYLWDNPQKYKMLTFNPPNPAIAFPHIRLDLDDYKDYLRLMSLDINPNMASEEILEVANRNQL